MQNTEQFKQVMELLETDKYFGVSVIDLSGGAPKPLLSSKTKSFIIEKSGSIAGYFNELMHSGIKKIGILPRKKNGSGSSGQSWVDHPKYPYFEFEFEAKKSPAVNSNPPVHDQPTFLAQPGLYSPDMLKIHIDASKYQETLERNKFLEQENATQKQKLYKFQEKKLKWKNAKTPNPNVMGLGQIFMEHADKLEPLLGRIFKLPAVAAVEPGLANPSNLSEIQINLIRELQKADEITISIQANVYNRQDQDEFINELSVLFQKYPVENVS